MERERERKRRETNRERREREAEREKRGTTNEPTSSRFFFSLPTRLPEVVTFNSMSELFTKIREEMDSMKQVVVVVVVVVVVDAETTITLHQE